MRLSCPGSGALEHRLNSVVRGLSCPEAGVIFLDQGWNPCLLHLQEDSFTPEPPGNPNIFGI